MTRPTLKLFALAALALGFGLVGCPGGGNEIPSLTVTAKPRAIDDMGQTSTIAIDTTDEKGLAGSGTVNLKTEAGLLSAASVTLDANGHGEVTFSCAVASDAKCAGMVKVSADWTTKKGTKTSGFTTLQVGPLPVNDAGQDGGTFDPSVCLTGGNVLAFEGDATDKVHPGSDVISNGTWAASASVTNDDLTLSVVPFLPSQGSFWGLEFTGATPGQPLVTGSFSPAERNGHPGLDVFTDGGHCAMTVGSYDISDIAFSPNGLDSFTATFTQTCGGADGGLRGCIHVEGLPLADAGMDAGMDAGTGDGGTSVNILALTLAKPALVINTGDHLDITATLTLRATGAPVPNTAVDFSTTAGSFAAAAGTLSASGTTDANGQATVTLYAASATGGVAMLSVGSLDATATAQVAMLNVASIVHSPDATEKSVLGIQSGGRETTTAVIFKVNDANNNPAPGVLVDFTIGPGSAAGGSVTQSAISDANGLVKPVLQSGNTVGSITVVATVAATETQTSPITASASFPVVGGKPSFSGLVVSCQQRNLGALDAMSVPPTRTLQTSCTASLADRFSNVVKLPNTQVSWFAERGTIDNPTTANTSTGVATATYQTTSSQLPNDVAPLVSPAEPSLGAHNPRDMLITIVAVVGGEEDFADLNNNGKWDPGEWFLDLPEPFVDENDNQQWDPGEQFFDTQRLNCQTGQLEMPNGKWDPPNGCWDNNTQIWAPTHILWSSPSIGTGPVSWSIAPPWTVAPSEVKIIDFIWPDGYYGPIDHTGAAFTVSIIGTRGSAAIDPTSNVNAATDNLGLTINYQRLNATETDAGTGIFNINGTCDFSVGTPSGPLNRCISRYSFASFGTGNVGRLTLTGPGPQGPLPDGGVAPPVHVTVVLGAQDSYFNPVQAQYDAYFQ